MAHGRRATPADRDLDPELFDSAAQQSAAWLAWSDRTAIDARIETLFTETLPRLEAVWGSEGRPSLDDRYSAAAFDWIVSLIDTAVLGEGGRYASERLSRRPIHHLCRRVDGAARRGRLVQLTRERCADLRRVRPAVGYRWSQESTNDFPVLLFMMAVDSDDGPYGYFVDLLHGRALTFARERDRPDLEAEIFA
ncbi:hypothetical protein GFY24_25105 [Nocardia sp. SYP-A9097]|uniref:hypothetical protein n=1 Tax=Nocardia sp. SYP-A9097 TaxID=2663237 RepID=UPI00129BEE83|nr:hypothetical protein [Nocardia sp. SYP-A9097]MRH90680.1 hypothetical protein [Nocardia sp. SYP-A9097]